MHVAVGRDLFLDFCTSFPGSVDNTRALHDHQFMERLELASIYAKAGERQRETERDRERQREGDRDRDRDRERLEYLKVLGVSSFVKD